MADGGDRFALFHSKGTHRALISMEFNKPTRKAAWWHRPHRRWILAFSHRASQAPALIDLASFQTLKLL